MEMQFVSGKAGHQLDDKNRTRIPAKFKSAFPQNEKLFFVKYSPGCIAIMCESVMERKLLSFGDVDPADEEVYDAKRFIYTVVDDLVEDTQHRFMIHDPQGVPRFCGSQEGPHFRRHGGLHRDLGRKDA